MTNVSESRNIISLAHEVMKGVSDKLIRYDTWMTVWVDEVEIGVADKTLWSSKHDKCECSVENCLAVWRKING